MIAIGVDPDTNTPAIAIAYVPDFQDVRIASVPKALFVGIARAPRAFDVERRIRRLLVTVPQAVAGAMGGKFEGLRGHVDGLVVEGQDTRGNRHARPIDLIHLAQVAGLIVGRLTEFVTPDAPLEERVWIPKPYAWKGSVEKAIHQARILEMYGLNQELTGVPGAEEILPSARNHVWDALGLAAWGLEQLGARLVRPRRFGRAR